jgi:hypothetical protein
MTQGECLITENSQQSAVSREITEKAEFNAGLRS